MIYTRCWSARRSRARPSYAETLVASHVADPRPRPNHDSDIMSLLGVARATSGDGFLLLDLSL
jgi:hypothetical protein